MNNTLTLLKKEPAKRTRGFLCETPIIGSFFPKESQGVVELPKLLMKTPENAQFRRTRFSSTIMHEDRRSRQSHDGLLRSNSPYQAKAEYIHKNYNQVNAKQFWSRRNSSLDNYRDGYYRDFNDRS